MNGNQENLSNSVEKSLKDINWSALTENRIQDINLYINWPALTQDRKYYPSPATWEDEVIYFLLVDRFSDKKEYGGFADSDGNPINIPTAERTTPLFYIGTDSGKADFQTWFEAGKKWCGGTIAGLKDKLGYLKRLGITTIWLSPVFKQVSNSDTYHGYGVQNFLDIDSRFGTREELKDFVEAAHNIGLRVILDIILNHAGDVFAYQDDLRYFYLNGQQWPVKGFRQEINDKGSLPFESIDLNLQPQAWPDGAIWPKEFQERSAWTCQGEIRNWNSFPEFLEGDFLTCKDIYHGEVLKDLSSLKEPNSLENIKKRIEEFNASQTLFNLVEVYKFWIAFADIDGFRVDAVKHIEPGSMRIFANAIHEFAESIGKENFCIIGEVTGGRSFAVDIVNTTGIDAALGIDDVQGKLEFLAKGRYSPGNPTNDKQEGYFDLFMNGLPLGKATHQWFGKHIVVMFDDHDQIDAQHKFRFCGDNPDSYRFLPVALGLNLSTAGIPCIYYGTEQALNGGDHRTGDDTSYSDIFLRECLFGGPFGSYQSTDRHFFNENHEVYRFIKEVCALRQEYIALRRGRQYLRQVSHTGQDGDFYYPQSLGGELHWVVAWSRVFADEEYLCAINTDANQSLTVWATVDENLNPPGRQMTCLFSTDSAQKNSTVIVENKNDASVKITVPKAGFVVYH